MHQLRTHQPGIPNTAQQDGLVKDDGHLQRRLKLSDGEAPMPSGVATAPAPSVRTRLGSIADGPTARQRSAATACA